MLCGRLYRTPVVRQEGAPKILQTAVFGVRAAKNKEEKKGFKEAREEGSARKLKKEEKESCKRKGRTKQIWGCKVVG